MFILGLLESAKWTDFLLVIIELFSVAVMLVELRANIDWKSPLYKGVGHFVKKIHIQRDIPHQPFVHR